MIATEETSRIPLTDGHHPKTLLSRAGFYEHDGHWKHPDSPHMVAEVVHEYGQKPRIEMRHPTDSTCRGIAKKVLHSTLYQ